LDGLKELNIDYLFVAALGSGVEASASKAAMRYCKRKNIPGTFFAFVNSARGISVWNIVQLTIIYIYIQKSLSLKRKCVCAVV
jgi:hypothetical protein